jgi:hypothetical protein
MQGVEQDFFSYEYLLLPVLVGTTWSVMIMAQLGTGTSVASLLCFHLLV